MNENKNETKWQNIGSENDKKDKVKDKIFVPDNRERRDGPGGN